MAKQARRLCHRLAGSISMAELALPTTARTHPPPPPPPPPVCWRRSVYVEVCRKARMQRRALAPHASAHHGALTSPQVCRKARMQRRALALAISLAAKQVEAEAVEAASAAAAALAREQASPPRASMQVPTTALDREQASPWAHPTQGTIATPLLQSSRPLKGHLGELRALLCLAPAAIQLPLQPAHVRRAAEALGYALKPSCPPQHASAHHDALSSSYRYSLKPSMPTDVPKLWCAVAFAAAPLPPPWKQSPQGYQNTLSGAISAVHPLLQAYQRVPRKFHEEPPNAKLLHLRWMEFAPPPEAEGSADGSAPAAAQNGGALERRAGSPTGQRADAPSPTAAEPITETARAGTSPLVQGSSTRQGGSLGGTWLVDMVSGQRTTSLEEALPDCPFISSEIMPPFQQEPSAKALTLETLEALRASGEPPDAAAARLCTASLEARIAALGTCPISLHELHAASVYLGVPLRTHPQLLWLASAAVCSGLPLGWLEAPAEPAGAVAGAQAPMYYNPTLGVAQHEHPAFCYWRGVALFLLEGQKKP